MKKVMNSGLLMCLALAATEIMAAESASPAANKDTEKKSVWKAEAELGYVKTTGNSETDSLNFKFNAQNQRNRWKHSARLETLKNADKSGTTAERYLIAGKTEYGFKELDYVFARVQYEDDRFSGYDYQASEVIGYGRRLVKTDTLHLNAEVGAGSRQNKLENNGSDSEGIVLLGGDLDWKISKSATLTEELTVEIGEDRTISKSITGLKTKINSKLSSKVTYTAKHSSAVPVGTEKTDTELAVTLVYTF